MKKILIAFITLALFANFNAQFLDNEQSQNNLAGLSLITVTIGGDFLVNGSFPASRTERLDQFITRIYNEARSQAIRPVANENLLMKFISEAENFALRDITLKRMDGSEQKIDLKRFRLTGNFENNPYLKNDDVVIFPNYDLEYDFVDISGAINKPGKFQFVEGDKLEDALLFAGGINKAYENVNTAVISRLSYNGETEERIEVGLKEEFYLKRGDRIKVVADQTKRQDYKVLVLGEVQNPGYYYITKNSTTLKEVIDLAGGFTPQASLKDAKLIRNFNSEQVLRKYALEKQDEDDLTIKNFKTEYASILSLDSLKMIRTADLTWEDVRYFDISNKIRLMEGISTADFTELDKQTSDTTEFIVKNDDLILVPEQFKKVYVFGQVGAPGYYDYVDGKNYKYYLSQAGGLAETAKDESEIFVIKSDKQRWVSIEEDGVNIEVGDFVYVPRKLPRDFGFYLERVSSVMGIVGTVATVVLLINQFGK